MPYPKLPPYAWPDGKSSAVCFSVDVDAEAPYLWANRNGLPDRLSQIEMRKFGPRRGLWRLAEMLDSFGIKGSFYVPGVVAELHPEVLPGLVENGHEVGLHGWLHELVRDNLTHDEFCRALDRSLEIFHRQIGRPPNGFRSPAWEMTSGMFAEVNKRGLLYDSSLMGFDHPYEVDGMIEIPVHGPPTTRSSSSLSAAGSIIGHRPLLRRSARRGSRSGAEDIRRTPCSC